MNAGIADSAATFRMEAHAAIAPDIAFRSGCSRSTSSRADHLYHGLRERSIAVRPRRACVDAAHAGEPGRLTFVTWSSRVPVHRGMSIPWPSRGAGPAAAHP